MARNSFVMSTRQHVEKQAPEEWPSLQTLLQWHFHEDIGAAIGHWGKSLRPHMAKPNRFVQVNSVLEPCIAAEKQRFGADTSGLRNCVLKQTPADASAAQVRRDRHLGKLVDTMPHGHQRD